MNLSQLVALVRLRFQLTKNQIRKGGQVNSVLYGILSVGLILFVLSSFFGAIAFGAIVFAGREPADIRFAWNLTVVGFLVLWGFHFMNRIQQNDAISVDKLLHLPITFRGAFLLNYFSTFANLTFLTLAPTIVGLAIAMPIARGAASAIAIPLTLSFLFMITALTWQLRSWFTEKMQNKRTKGILMAVLPLAAVGFFVAVVEFTDSSLVSLLKDYHLSLVSSGIMAAESGSWISGVLGSLAMTAIGCGSLLFAFSSSLRRFSGTSSARVSAGEKQSPQKSEPWLESGMFSLIPGVTGPASVVARGTMRSLRRAPEAFAALVPLIMLMIFGTPYLIGMEGFVVPAWIVGSWPIALIAVALVGFPAFLFSTFSYDRDGFRAYVLSPMERQDILFGKNLAIGIPTILLGWLSMVVVQCFLPVGPLWFLGSLICLVPSFLLLCIVGNAISVFFPVGLKRGSMTPVNAQIIPVVLLYVGILGGPFLTLLPTYASFALCYFLEVSMSMTMGWLYALLSLIQLLVAWFAYRKSLDVLGPWLWRRESELIGVVANIPE